MHTRYPVTKNHPESAFVAHNMKITGHGVEPIKGFSRFGQESPANLQKIKDAYTFILQDGTQIPVRVRERPASGDNVLEWYSTDSGRWEILLTGMTQGATTSFQDYNTSTINQLFFGNGNEYYSVWSGNTTYLTAALSGGETDVLVNSTAGFPASGTIIYNGTEIAYSSKTATKFVVASAHASSDTDDPVAEAVDDATYSGVALSSILLSAQNRMWVVDAGDPNSLEYSVEGDATDWTSGNNRADAGVEDFPIVGGKITGLANQDSYIFIFKERTIILFEWQYPTATTKTPSFKHIVTAGSIGAINHKGIASIYNEILYTAPDGVRSLSRNIATNDWNADPISDEIKTTIDGYDFSEAASIYYAKEDVYLVACKSDSDQTNNNKVIAIWYYVGTDGKRQRGFSILDWTVDSWFIYNNELYFGSSMEGATYKAFTGHTRGGAAMRSIYTDNRNDFGAKNLKEAESYLIMGLIAPGTEIDVSFFYDGGASGSQQITIDAADDYVQSSAVKTLGAFKLGEQVLGGTLDAVEELRLFTVIVELQKIQWYDLQVQRICGTKGGYYKIFFEGIINPGEGFDLPQDTLEG